MPFLERGPNSANALGSSASVSPLRYVRCDVFTDRPLAGNALAVFADASWLDGGTMQAVAREMNLSETVFIFPPTTKGADSRLRIFTPTIELPFAGHPTLGAAFVLAASNSSEALYLETGSGIVPVRLSRQSGNATFGWMSQPLPKCEAYPDAAAALRCLGVPRSLLPIELYRNGPRCVYVELETPQEVADLRPDLRALASLGPIAFSVFARVGPSGARWKCRVFVPGAGVPEDPATGAAACPLALHLARHGRIAFGDEIVIEQGAEIARPSTLHARAVGTASDLEAIEVGGSAVVVGGGEIFGWTRLHVGGGVSRITSRG